MKWVKFIIGALAIICTAVVIYFVLHSEKALLAHPKGVIADKELKLIITITILMLLIVAPTFVLIYLTAWRFRKGNKKAKFEPEHDLGRFGETMLWLTPSLIVLAMAIVTWVSTHDLDPYKPLENGKEPLNIQVIALDWKWLFIYPDHGIATLNFVSFPEKRPINFKLAADNSPMNSFWIPELSGQIYCMTGMVTPLHIIANETGTYSGRAAEINGEGLASMTFNANVVDDETFESWVKEVKESPQKLDNDTYDKLLIRSEWDPPTLYSSHEKDLFNKIVMKYMMPHHER